MARFKYGDIICYKGENVHDEPLMYVSPCSHYGGGLIDIFDLTGKYLLPDRNFAHKSPDMWEKCNHIILWAAR